MVVNLPTEYDFTILGNAFYFDPLHPENGGSAEPGIVLVSYDANHNGLPDDEWYELAGSEYMNRYTIPSYSVTYTREADTIHNRWHQQPYYPQWVTENQYTLTGSRLPNNYKKIGANYLLYAYDYGYADNHPNTAEKAKLNINWAVDKAGKAVSLPGIHFVKVYTAVDQTCGNLGETSTEITGAIDLHPDANTAIENTLSNWMGMVKIYNISGQLVFSSAFSQDLHNILPALPAGIYMVQANHQTIKIINH